MTFKRCCNISNQVNYNISHEPVPMKWNIGDNEALHILLWYMPSIDSKQSHQSELIENMMYDEIMYKYFKDKMDMEDSDFLYLYNTELEDNLWDYYKGSICKECQKAIIVAYSTHTKIKNLLRCIRNAVAHGDFMIVEDTLIGFNENKGKKKAVIKIKYKKLIEALKVFDFNFTTEREKAYFIAYSLKNIGYEVKMEIPVIVSGTKIRRFDIIATKDNNKYVFEIKATDKFKYLKPEDLEPHLKAFDEFNIDKNESNTKFVFVFDDYKLTKDAKILMEEYSEKCIILDRISIQKLFAGIDVFSEIDN